MVDRVWPALPKIAIDYAVAEPAAESGRLAVVPGHFDWDDVGDFASLTKLILNGRKNDLAVLGPPSAGCSPTRPAGSWSARPRA